MQKYHKKEDTIHLIQLISVCVFIALIPLPLAQQHAMMSCVCPNL